MTWYSSDKIWNCHKGITSEYTHVYLCVVMIHVSVHLQVMPV